MLVYCLLIYINDLKFDLRCFFLSGEHHCYLGYFKKISFASPLGDWIYFMVYKQNSLEHNLLANVNNKISAIH